MSFAVRKLPGEPIVIVSVCFPIDETLQDYVDINYQVARIADHTDGLLYRISDARHIKDISFADIYLWIQMQRDYPEGAVIDPRVYPIYVGTHPVLEASLKKIRSQLGIEMPAFQTLSAAIHHVRQLAPKRA